MPDPIRIRSGLAEKHWPEAGRRILANQMHLACFQTRRIWPNPDQAIQFGFGFFVVIVCFLLLLFLHNMIHAFFGKTELKRLREVGSGMYYPARLGLYAGRNGHDWP